MAAQFSTCFAASVAAAVALDWLVRDARPRMMLDAALRVRWCNAQATRELDRNTGISIRDGMLCFAKHAAQRDFQEFLAGLDEEMRTIAVPCREGGTLLFRGRGLDEVGGRVACVEFTRDHPGFVARYYDIDRVFGLTPAEDRVVQSLLAGRTVGGIASDLGVAVGTVRTHVRRIYSKTAVRSREELLSRLRPYCVM